ncbi:MAG: periplasmic flagellar collar protein FlcA, partial [Alkalispirochaeta sp.]
ELGDEDDAGELDEFSVEDFGDIEDDFGADTDDFDTDLGEFTSDIDLDSGEINETDALDEAEELADADFAAATEELEEDTGFGSDFGDQVAADFGDIDLDDSNLSDDPLADLDDDAFELPAVDDEIDSLDEEGFSLGDFGEEFDINEESIDEFAGLDIETEGLETDETVEEAAAAPEEYGPPPEREFSDTEFRHIQTTLGSLPLNVKIPVEEIIGEGRGTPEQINTLIDMLIAGAAPTAVAEHISKILDKKITVPKGYQKKSGVAFEEEKQTLAYRLRYVVFPIIRVAVVVSIVAAIVGLLGYRFVYRPIHAAVLYRQGYEEAQFDQYETANDTFRRAWELRPRDEWFSTYAELYVEKYQYQLAVEKYDQLVFGMDPDVRSSRIEAVRDGELGRSYQVDAKGGRKTLYELLNVDKEAILDHAELQSRTLANFQRADELYSIILYGSEFDYEALLGRGDNYMRWAEEDPANYERARLTYATMLSQFGDTDEILMRFLRYFVRTDNEEQVRTIVTIFEEGSPEAEIHPVIYAEAAGYLLDRGEVAGVRDMLIRAYETDAGVPEIHYELARYNRETESGDEERQSLDNALGTFAAEAPLPRRRQEMQIDAYIRSGEYWHTRDQILRAQEEYNNALELYETNKESAFLPADPDLARVYAHVGDIHYYEGREYDLARQRYEQAVADGYLTDELNYKLGFIYYRDGRYDRANELFYDIGSENPFDGERNVIYARANTLYHRGNYVAAEALYEDLLDTLQVERSRIRTLLVDEDTTHRSLVEYLVKVRNNLGVTRYRVGERLAGLADENPNLSRSLADLQASTELSANYLRDPDTGVRAAATDLAFLNIREILYPEEGGFEPQIYEELPRDISQELW